MRGTAARRWRTKPAASTAIAAEGIDSAYYHDTCCFNPPGDRYQWVNMGNSARKDSLMNLSEPLVQELAHESISTRKALERTPSAKFEWKPHEKSTTLGRLASHIADIPGWMNIVINQDEFDGAGESFSDGIGGPDAI